MKWLRTFGEEEDTELLIRCDDIKYFKIAHRQLDDSKRSVFELYAITEDQFCYIDGFYDEEDLSDALQQIVEKMGNEIIVWEAPVA